MRRAVAIACGLLLSTASEGLALDDAEQLGRRLFHEGIGTGPVSATVGAGVVLPGSAVACASCHGPDGRGRPEGAVSPPDIRWSALTRSWGHVHAGGRQHEAFDARTFRRAVTTGLDPAGNRLESTMPRYAMRPDDLAHLVAYLRRLEDELDPGLTADRIRLATVLPTRGVRGAIGRTVKAVLETRLAAVNAAGGIHGRRLELVVADYDADRETGAERLRQFVADDEPFAILSGVAGDTGVFAELSRRHRLPVVCPLEAAEGGGFDDAVFALGGGMRDQAHALAQYLVRDEARRGIAILHPSGAMEPVAREVASVLERGRRTVTRVSWPRGGLARATLPAADVLLFLGDEAELAQLLSRLVATRARPTVLVGSDAARAALAVSTFEGRLVVAAPTLPTDIDRAALRRLPALAAEHPLEALAAAAAVEVFLEALVRAGRGLSRSAFVARLETLHRFRTGVSAPLTFGPNRRTGARGAYVAELARGRNARVPDVAWIELAP